ncbi:hypothetical protein EUX57_00120 [Pseudomonas orientalis]|uniref:Uncharacterized protein n=1 Tax=Pseudomonas orientalis TaxID=76758 RepID=A0A4Q7DAS8_9PSED|nr:hypothetical protein EUX57_00120 [Pseudomonas orientalis]
MTANTEPHVGGGLPPIAECQWLKILTGLPPSGHRYLHNSAAPNRNHDAQRVALDLDLDLLLISGAPLNHAGRTQA